MSSSMRLSGAFPALAAALRFGEDRGPSRADAAGAIAYCIAALALAAYAAAGLVTAPWWAVALAVGCLIAFGAAVLLRGKRSEIALRRWALARPVVVALSVPLGFCLLEAPWNDLLAAMDLYYVAVNLCVLAVLFAVVYLAAQRSRAGVAAFLAACLLAGVANHFVIMFKGQPVVPADLFALSTAASVGSGYAYALDERLLVVLVAFAGACAVLAYLPKIAATPKRLAVNTACALIVAAGFGWWMGAQDIEEAYGCTVDVWGVKESYAGQGTTLCFLKRVQDLTPARPEGYDPEAAAAMLAANAGDATAIDPAEAPTVIAIMNETFSDLSRYPGLADTDARPAAYYDIAENALASGEAFASAMGGGTCNSEFEFLTGSSMGHLGGGVYPYVLYDLDKTESLVSYFSSLGYATHALHPAEASNWRRDRIYDQLGFDDFADEKAFEDADTLRNLVTDRATYDYVLDLLEADAGPQFVFDVTIQNHGGYDVGGIDAEDHVSVPLPDGSVDSELDEFSSCIRRSDEDLAYLVERLDALDRPVVLCFFGDHQPGFSDRLFAATHDGAAADDLGLEAVQERYTVPYLIWANAKARANGAEALENAEATSLNYLGAQVVQAAGLPATSYQRFLMDVRETIPAINLNGFLTADGTWHWFGDQTDADGSLKAYAVVQYDNLFNKGAERSDAWVDPA